MSENTYVFDPESPSELTRLIDLDRLTTRAMGGPLNGLPRLPSGAKVVDLACGPGGWVLDTASDRPEITVSGFDISKGMIRYAQARANSRGLSNATFDVINITKPLDLPDESFDLVNARFLTGVLLRNVWPLFIAECKRILKPGGILRLTEFENIGVTSSPSAERVTGLMWQAIKIAGYGFSVNGRSTGMLHRLPYLLRKAGFTDIQYMAHALEFSSGTTGWIEVFRNYEIGMLQVKALYLKLGLISEDEFNKLYHQMLIEMQQDDFTAMMDFMSFWSIKE